MFVCVRACMCACAFVRVCNVYSMHVYESECAFMHANVYMCVCVYKRICVFCICTYEQSA